MKKSWRFVVNFLLVAVLLAIPIGMSSAYAADSGGYGSSSGYGGGEESSGYGGGQESSGYGGGEESSGYGGGEESSGYGGGEESSGGYGGEAPASSSGYGGGEESSGGYGGEAPASSSGYGGGEEASGGYGGEAPAASSGYSGGEEAPAATTGYAEEKPAAGYAEEAAPSAGYAEEAPAKAAPVIAPVKKAPTKKAPAKRVSKPGKKMSISFVVSALVVGMLLGWVLQRGRFCMNTAFRDTIFIKEMTLLRAYVVALMVSIVGANLLDHFGILSLQRQPFFPIAQIVGGYVFGLGIVLAGGCGSGIWYRAGEGQLASYVAIMGFFTGIVTTVDGLLKPLNKWMMSISVPIGGSKAPGLWHFIGDGPMIKWGTIAVLVIVGFIFIQKDKPFSLGKQKGYYWSVTGLLVGLVSVLAFWASDYFGGFARGLSFTTPTRELFYTIFQGTSNSRFFPNKELTYLGYTVSTTWGIFFIVGVPLGAFLSARGFKEFAWKTPPAKEMLVVFGGSLMMGFGASTALGCNMGQGITGFSTLSIGSIAATIAILLGNWTMVYFKFIKPMNDMDLD